MQSKILTVPIDMKYLVFNRDNSFKVFNLKLVIFVDIVFLISKVYAVCFSC